MEIRELEAFYHAATMRSFSRAAERLATSQPTISARVAALERQLGVKLFERAGRSARLTARGRDLLGWAERILGLVRDAEGAVGDPSEHRGTVRLGTAETIVHTWLPALMERVRKAFPRLDLELTVDVSPNLRNGLESRELDLAFLMGPLAGPTFTNYALCAYPLTLAAAPALGLGGRITAERLLEHPVITFPRNTRPTELVVEAIRRRTGRTPRLVASGAMSANIHLALAGAGVALVPEVVVRRELAAGRLKPIRSDFPLEPLRFTATHLGPASPGVEAVTRLALEAARDFGRRPNDRKS